MKMFFAIFAMILGLSQVTQAREQRCYPDPSYPAFMCHAYDAGRRTHGASGSFNNRQAAAQRALASCQRKSPQPATCAITRCNTPPTVCEGDND